jgi:hypothetical protein
LAALVPRLRAQKKTTLKIRKAIRKTAIRKTVKTATVKTATRKKATKKTAKTRKK